MKFKMTNRQSLSAAVIVFYLIPILFFSSYSIGLMSHQKSWALLSLGLLTMVGGTLILIFFLYYWEQFLQDRKQEDLLSSTPQLVYFSSEKEAKVTSLETALTLNQRPHDELSEQAELKENTKELNLLQAALKESLEQQEQLTRTLELKGREWLQLEEENRGLQLKVQQVVQDFADYKLFSEEQLKQKQLQLVALQQMVEDQRAEMERRQEQIHQLDAKVHDLSYEIKTLLYLHEEEAASVQPSEGIKKEEITPVPLYVPVADHQESFDARLENLNDGEIYGMESSIRTPAEALNLLRKCIDMAQKLTGANYYHNESSRYREFSSSYYAIDQRRLFDNLRHETSALIIVYSQKEQKILFANHQCKTLLGWSPEKFVADFASIMQEGLNDWKKLLNLLTTVSDAQTRLLAKTKQGQEALLNCHLGIIPTGLFRHYVIGVLYLT